MKLNDITQYIQDICQNISNVLDVDVTVVSKDLYRIAGTGIFKDKIGDKISEEAVYSNVLKTGNAHVINKDIEQSCKICSSREHCKELADICTPIKLGDDGRIIYIYAPSCRQDNHFDVLRYLAYRQK